MESEYVTVHDAKMHYLIQGKGKPLVFLHGVPTSSHLWRNIIPQVSAQAMCIAPDLIGMGKSDKPPIEYTIRDHIRYFEGFIDAIGLTDFTLVMLGWGSVVGLAYANRHPGKITGLIFMEAYLTLPQNFQDVPLPIQELGMLFRDPEKLKRMIIEENYAIEKFLPNITLRKYSSEELDDYRLPFKKKEDRQPLWQFIVDQPFFNKKSPAIPIIEDYSAWLQTTSIPKLLIYAMPGFLTSMHIVKWAMTHLRHLTVADVGYGLHFLPETRPEEIAEAIISWLAKKDV